MDPLRGTLLWASGNATLREHLPRFRAVRKTVERFMPGETAEDGLNAAQRLATDGLPATFTLLGENVDDMSQAAAAAGEYLRLLDRIDALGLDAEVSVKLSQLGFDLEPEATMVHMERLADRSADMGRTVWIDMESSAYVGGTIDLYASLLARSPNSGLCLQAYLHRTWDDVQKLAPMRPTIRLVKGAYREPKDVAFQDKRADRRELLPAREPSGDELPAARARHARHGPRRADRGRGARAAATRSRWRCSTASARTSNAGWRARAMRCGR